MYCPNCNSERSDVVDTRPNGEDGVHRWRRRKCRDCKERYTTYEIQADEYATLQADALAKKLRPLLLNLLDVIDGNVLFERGLKIWNTRRND